MAISPDILEKLREEAPGGLDLGWLDADNGTGVRLQPGRRGLTLHEIEIGAYGEVPATTSNASYKPGGALARSDVPRTGLSYGERDDVRPRGPGPLPRRLPQRPLLPLQRVVSVLLRRLAPARHEVRQLGQGGKPDG